MPKSDEFMVTNSLGASTALMTRSHPPLAVWIALCIGRNQNPLWDEARTIDFSCQSNGHIFGNQLVKSTSSSQLVTTVRVEFDTTLASRTSRWGPTPLRERIRLSL